MNAVVIHEAGGPEVLLLETRPIPVPKKGEVLIKVKGFGLNRSELFTRQGLSPSVQFPRILGIEATGEVVEAPDGQFLPGEVVVTAMGGLGRTFDGGYAEYTCPPASQVVRITNKIPWEILAAIPEMLQTAYGALFKALKLHKGEVLLVRGGTTSVGLAAAAIAKNFGATVVSTTRREGCEEMLKEHGADLVLVDDGSIAPKLRQHYPHGVDKVWELIGTTTLLDSLQCAKEGGAVCMSGMVGNSWSLADFSPMDSIPTAVNLTTYAGGSDDVMATPFDDLIQQIVDGTLKIRIGRTFKLNEIVEAHRCMEENRARGKIVVLTE